jgi:anti-sigma regulatory factor (Ser/Thr protein kinase)
VTAVIDAGRAGEHVVQFYDSDEDLVARAGDHLLEGMLAGDTAIVIASEPHRRAFEARLRDGGAGGALVMLDAAATLTQLMRDGRVDRDAFYAVVGETVRNAAATGRPVHAFGEMVSLLWDAGDVGGAIDLETLWNELAEEIGFSLYCAYHSESVSGSEHVAALEHVCHLHTAVMPAAVDNSWDFAAESTAPSKARHLATAALRRAGCAGRVLEDAELVVSELATNAVLHARSPFSVSVRSSGREVRVLVRDRSPDAPVMQEPPITLPCGRGLRLIAAIASRWGVDPAPDGKVVWAELVA